MRIPTEDKLAANFNVGRGSIREAITSWQMSGILVSSPGLGRQLKKDRHFENSIGEEVEVKLFEWEYSMCGRSRVFCGAHVPSAIVFP